MSIVFISHSHDDDAFVTRLAEDLRAAGVRTWVDHEDIAPGQDWDEAVQGALEKTGALVLVLSPSAAASQNVKVEWSFFLELGKPIFPAVLQECDTPFRLRLLQQIDFASDYDAALNRLVAGLRQGTLQGSAPPAARRKKSAARPVAITLNNARQMDALVVLSGHTDSVRSVAFSPDGALLASGSDDKNVRLWKMARRAPLKMLIGHEKAVRAVAFHPQGSLLVSASEDRTVRLWDAERRFGLTALSGHTTGVTALAFEPMGTQLASASEDGTLRLWEMSRRAVCGNLDGHAGPVTALVFDPDGMCLVSAGLDGTVRLWEVERGTAQAVIPIGHPVHALAFSPDGSLLLVGTDGGGVIALDPATQTRLGTIFYADYNANCVRGLAFSPGGTLLAIASLDGSARLWRAADLKDAGRGRAWRMLRGHEGGLCGVAFSPDGTLLATASHDRTIRLWGVVE